MNEAGRILQNRYRIDRQIGQGGMGAVYVASDERFGSTVAIKETLCMDDNYRRAIEREARLLNSLKHTALPRVSDHFIEDNGQFLVMEYIPGEDLAYQMEHEGIVFSVDQVVKWADQLLDALEYLHNQEMPVIHRDIKPQNLKITSSGQIILLDFGLAKGSPAESPNQTAGKSIFGYTRNYASLEQIQGTGTDPRSDLYSLAATLYHLLTGVPPEDALTRAMAVLSQRDDPLVPANVLRPDIPKGLAGVLHRTLDLNAAQRPSSAAEMRQMLADHNEYEHFADVVTVAARRVETSASAQATKLMPAVTQADWPKNTDVQTFLMQGMAPGQTAVRSGNSGDVLGITPAAGAGSGKLRLAAVAASVISVIFAGTVLAGIYFYDQDLFAAEAMLPAEPAPVIDPSAVVAESPLPPELQESVAVAAPEIAEAPGAAERPRVENPRTRAAEPTRSRATASARSSWPDTPEIVIRGGKVFMGNTVISETSIETPRYYMDENGVKRKIPVPPKVEPFKIPLTAEQMKHLTPEQKRKLRMVWRNYPATADVKPPATPNPNE